MVIKAIINLIKLVITYLCKQKELKHTALILFAYKASVY